jgi:hypothetical protein
MRLKISHEARARLGVSIERKSKRKQSKNGGKNGPSADHEVWMLIRTEEECIRDWERQRGVGGDKGENGREEM